MEQTKVRTGNHRVSQSALRAPRSWSAKALTGSLPPEAARGVRGFRSRESAQTWNADQGLLLSRRSNPPGRLPPPRRPSGHLTRQALGPLGSGRHTQELDLGRTTP